MQVASTKKLPATLESSRLFSSAIANPLRVEARNFSGFHRTIGRTPEIPGCSRPVGSPALSVSLYFFWHRHRTPIIRNTESVAYTEVVDGQDIRSSQLEDQQHFDCPATDPTDRNKPLDDRFVVELPNDRACRHGPVERLGRQVAKGGNLGLRKSGATNCLLVHRKQIGWLREPPRRKQGDEPTQNTLCRFLVQLLIRNGSYQRFKRRPLGLWSEGEGTDVTDQLSHDRICFGQMPHFGCPLVHLRISRTNP